MSGFFFDLVKDAVNYDDTEQQAALYALRLKDMRVWCEDQLDNAGVPDNITQYILQDLFAGDSEFPYKLWRYIQDFCQPHTQPEEEDAPGFDMEVNAETGEIYHSSSATN